MAIVPISSLPAASALDGTEEIAANQGGTTVKVTAEQLAQLQPNRNTVTTSDATLTTIATIPLTDNTVYFINVDIVARRTDAPDRAVYKRYRAFYREGGGGATALGAMRNRFTEESDTSWTVQMNVSGNNVLIQVQGAAAKNVNWAANYSVQEVG